MNRFPALWLLALLLALVSCKPAPDRAPAIGEAYAGPASLKLRQDVSLQSPVVVTVTHGERLEILQRRRRLVKVRTPRLAEGWTDERLLLTAQEVANLRRLGERSKAAASLGAATTYETLNVHTYADRQSPSFLQVKEGEKVDVIGRRVAPRLTTPRLPPPAPKAQPKKKPAKESKKSQVPPPPPPVAPKPPSDWLQLSTVSKPPPPPSEPKPVLLDDWSQIRNAAGQSGWVLTRRLQMAIPDEVAQYAEGRRITSYFALGETRDGEKVKQSWLWTTVEHGLQPYDFDSFRIFVWSLRRHRYETAHIERNLTGYFPVMAHQAPPGFSLILEKKDGLRYRRDYTFVDNRVKLSREQRADGAASQPLDTPIPDTSPEKTPPDSDSFYSRLKRGIASWRERLFGR